METLGTLTVKVFSWVVRTSCQATVLAVIIVLAQVVFRKKLSPGWRYGLWLLLGSTTVTIHDAVVVRGSRTHARAGGIGTTLVFAVPPVPVTLGELNVPAAVLLELLIVVLLVPAVPAGPLE